MAGSEAGTEVAYPQYLFQVGEAEAAFVSAKEAEKFLREERSDITFFRRVHVDDDYVVSMSLEEVKKELGIEE